MGDGAAELLRYLLGRAILLRAVDGGDRGEGGTMCDTKEFATPGRELVLWVL